MHKEGASLCQADFSIGVHDDKQGPNFAGKI